MRYLIFGLILANLVIYYIVFDSILTKDFISFLNIGQGSGVLIKDRNNVFLYDTGKYPYLTFKEIDKLLPFYQRKIDILFLSHPDTDHYLAGFDLFKRYRIRSVVVSSLKTDDYKYLEFLQVLKSKNIPIIILKRGDEIKTKKFQFLILHPDRHYLKDNDKSLVIKISGKNSYLLLGDVGKDILEELIYCCSEILKTNYVLIPHHGSKHSLNENFYKLIKPNLAIIQVGKNFYGHPHKEVVDFLNNEKIKIWRTDLNGTLKIDE